MANSQPNAEQITASTNISLIAENKYMQRIDFASAEALRDFYKAQGIFALYLSEFQSVDKGKTIEHYLLVKSGDELVPDGNASIIFNIDSPASLEIISQFLNTDEVLIHPTQFEIKRPFYSEKP